MAWLDDRFWAHPKVTDLSDKSFRVAVSAILYSHGFGLYGRLNSGHQKAIGSTPKTREQLVAVGLWILDGTDVLIHDWDEHNKKHDERRKRDRERKRRERAARTSTGRPADSPRTVQGVSSRAPAGAGPMTSDRVTNLGVSSKQEGESKPIHVWQENDKPPDFTNILKPIP